MTDPDKSSTESDNAPATTEGLTTQVRLGGGTSLPWIVLGLVIAAGAALLSSGKLVLRPHADTPEGRTEALQEKARANAELGREADSVRHKADWIEARERLNTAKSALAAMAQSTPKFESQIQTLLTDDSGKRIASSPEWIQQFIVVRDSQRPTAEQIQVNQAAVEELLAICQKAIADEAIVVPCDKLFVAKVEKLYETAIQSQRSAEEALNGLSVLSRNAESATPGADTLAVAVSAADAKQAETRLALLVQAQAALREEIDRATRDQALETERKVHAAALEQAKAEDALKIAEAEAKSDQAKQIVANAQAMLATEQARLKRLTQFERSLPEIRSLLSPMVSNGKMQLGQSGWVQGEAGPLSLAALQATPAFRRINEDSWRNLGAMFCGPSCPNDRPRGSFPTTMSYHEQELRRAIELVADYGDLMVERKLLRP